MSSGFFTIRTASFQSEEKRFVHCRICRFRERRFGDKNHIAFSEAIDLFDEMCAQKTFRSVTLHGIAYLLTCDKPDPVPLGASVKKYEIRSVPDFVGAFVNPIEIFALFDTGEMFDAAYGLTPPIFFDLLHDAR